MKSLRSVRDVSCALCALLLAAGACFAQEPEAVDGLDIPPVMKGTAAALPSTLSGGRSPATVNQGEQMTFQVRLANPASVRTVALVFPDANVSEPMDQVGTDTWRKVRSMTGAGANRPFQVRITATSGQQIAGGTGTYSVVANAPTPAPHVVSVQTQGMMQLNNQATIVFSGQNLTGDVRVTVSNCDGPQTQLVSSSQIVHRCTPRAAGQQSAGWKANANSNLVSVGTVQVQATAAPTAPVPQVVSVQTQGTAQLNNQATIVFSGQNLTGDVRVTVSNCDGPQTQLVSSSQIVHRCTPRAAGQQSAGWKANANSNLVSAGTVQVQATPSPSPAPSPRTPTIAAVRADGIAMLNAESTLVFSGQDLTPDVRVTLANCENPKTTLSSSVQIVHTCTPRVPGPQTAGWKPNATYENPLTVGIVDVLQLGGANGTTVDTFIEKYTNRPVDVDRSYGYQCVDLMRQYAITVLGLNGELPKGNAYAIFAATTSNKFRKIVNSPNALPSKGDLIFWNQLKENGYAGHVGIFVDGSLDRFRSFDQNYCGNSGSGKGECAPRLVTHTYSGVAGWLSPASQSGQEPLLLPVVARASATPVTVPTNGQIVFEATIGNAGSVARVELVFPDANVVEVMDRVAPDIWRKPRTMTGAGQNRPFHIRATASNGQQVIGGNGSYSVVTSTTPPGVPTDRGLAATNALFDRYAMQVGIPPIIVKAVAYQESGWSHMDASGNVKVSGDGGVGIMQLQGGIRTQTEEENIKAGVAALLNKWALNVSADARQAVKALGGIDEDFQMDIMENWFVPLAGYNGYSGNGKGYARAIFSMIGNPSAYRNYRTTGQMESVRADVSRYFVPVASISDPGIIPGFSGGSASKIQAYSLCQMMQHGASIHRYDAARNAVNDVTQTLRGKCGLPSAEPQTAKLPNPQFTAVRQGEDAIEAQWSWDGDRSVLTGVEVNIRNTGTGSLVAGYPKMLAANATRHVFEGLGSDAIYRIAITYKHKSGMANTDGGATQELKLSADRTPVPPPVTIPDVGSSNVSVGVSKTSLSVGDRVEVGLYGALPTGAASDIYLYMKQADTGAIYFWHTRQFNDMPKPWRAGVAGPNLPETNPVFAFDVNKPGSYAAGVVVVPAGRAMDLSVAKEQAIAVR